MNLLFTIRENTDKLLFRNFLLHYRSISSNAYVTYIGSPDSFRGHKKLIEEYGYSVNQYMVIDAEYHMSYDEDIIKIMHSYIPDGEWVVNADVDEFLDIEKIPLQDLDQFDIYKGFLIDRIDSGLSFDKEITNASSINEDYPGQYAFIKIIPTSLPYKIPLYKKSNGLIITGGHHKFYSVSGYVPRVSPLYLKVFHYKWRKGILDYLGERIIYYSRNQNNEIIANAKQYLYEIVNQYKIIIHNKHRLDYFLNQYCRVKHAGLNYEGGIRFF